MTVGSLEGRRQWVDIGNDRLSIQFQAGARLLEEAQ
jgi:hypothetical protein